MTADKYYLEILWFRRAIRLLESIDAEGGGHVELGDVVDRTFLPLSDPLKLPPGPDSGALSDLLRPPAKR